METAAINLKRKGYGPLLLTKNLLNILDHRLRKLSPSSDLNSETLEVQES